MQEGSTQYDFAQVQDGSKNMVTNVPEIILLFSGKREYVAPVTRSVLNYQKTYRFFDNHLPLPADQKQIFPPRLFSRPINDLYASEQ